MKISTRGRYDLRAMVDLAMRYGREPAFLKDIAGRQDISMKYLDHIITPLRAAGLISRIKGGYILSRPPNDINCLEIINILEDSLAPVGCVDYPNICTRSGICVTIEIWRKIRNTLKGMLKSITLEDLAKHQEEKNKKYECDENS